HCSPLFLRNFTMPIASPRIRRSALAAALLALLVLAAGTPLLRTLAQVAPAAKTAEKGPANRNGVSSHSEVRHTLDPLDPDEIRAAVDIVKQEKKLAATFRFVTVTLNEPSKELVLRPRADAALPREAFLVLLDTATGTGYEAVVNLTQRSVVRFDAL